MIHLMIQIMKAIKKLIQNPLLYIFLLALLFRTFALGEFPAGFHVDEVKAGWNAYSILKTGLDDWGHPFPVYYDSFGDFRPTGIFYSIIPSILIFGLTEFATRFPGALFGALSVIPLFFLVEYFLKKSDNSSAKKVVPYFAAFLLAISPWHIALSRATSEGIIAMFLSLCGFAFFTKALQNNQTHPNSLTTHLLSLISLLLSYFFYHASRLLIPVLLGTIYLYISGFEPAINSNNLKKLFSKKLAITVLIIVCITTIIFASNKQATERFSQVSIFSDLGIKHDLDKYPFELGPGKVLEARIFFNKPLSYGRRFIEEYARYFSSDFFLVYGTAKPIRYEIAGMGLVSYVEFILLFLGIIAVGKYRFSTLPLFLLILSPLPAALTTEDSPNLHRALFMIPFLSVLMAYGFYYLYELNKKQKFILPITILFFISNFLFFLEMYFAHNPVHEPIPLYRNATARELALKIKDEQLNYDKILVTNIPDSIYPWYAFYTKQDPATFNNLAMKRLEGVWQYKNIEFSAQRCPSRDAFKLPSLQNTLVIDAEGCDGKDAIFPAYISIKYQLKRPDSGVSHTFWVEDKQMRKAHPELDPLNKLLYKKDIKI